MFSFLIKNNTDIYFHINCCPMKAKLITLKIKANIKRWKSLISGSHISLNALRASRLNWNKAFIGFVLKPMQSGWQNRCRWIKKKSEHEHTFITNLPHTHINTKHIETASRLLTLLFLYIIHVFVPASLQSFFLYLFCKRLY